jgi:large subunit ribosomal protein L10
LKITEKQKISDELKSKFIKTTSVILTDYKGLNVEAINLLRKKLREVGVEYKVIKNSLLIRASSGNSLECLKDEFEGPSALALCYDDNSSVALAKILVDFSSDHDVFKIKAGVLDNKFIDEDQINLLASLPSKEVLYANLLATMSAAPTSLVRLLSSVASSFVNILQAIKETKE